jgi:hypothetical protein
MKKIIYITLVISLFILKPIYAENSNDISLEQKIPDGLYLVFKDDSGRVASLAISLSTNESFHAESIVPEMIQDMEIRIANSKIFISFDLHKKYQLGIYNIIYVRESKVKFFTVQSHQKNKDEDEKKTFYFIEDSNDVRIRSVLNGFME